LFTYVKFKLSLVIKIYAKEQWKQKVCKSFPMSTQFLGMNTTNKRIDKI
jgi:hypothetical protein